MFKITGLDEAMKKLNDLQRFGSADEMYQASGFKIETPEDFAAIPDEDWDAFIRSISSFADWKSMLNEAGKEWAAQKLGLK